MNVTVIDQNPADLTATRAATVDVLKIEATITPWFPEAPADVTAAIRRLQAALVVGAVAAQDELAAYLGLTIVRPGGELQARTLRENESHVLDGEETWQDLIGLYDNEGAKVAELWVRTSEDTGDYEQALEAAGYGSGVVFV